MMKRMKERPSVVHPAIKPNAPTQMIERPGSTVDQPDRHFDAKGELK
jgi:hypothetical protein